MALLLAHPATLPMAGVLVGFVCAASLVIGISRGEAGIAEGRVATRTRLVRTEFTIPDEVATENLRTQKRATSPRVYNESPAAIAAIEGSLSTLPEVLASAGTYEEVAEEVRGAFALTPLQFEAVRGQEGAGVGADSWDRHVGDLMRGLATTPLLAGAEHQVAINQSQTDTLLLRREQGSATVSRSRAINIDSPDMAAIVKLANDAGFYGPLAEVIAQRLTVKPAPTYVFDDAATTALREARAAEVKLQTITFKKDEPLTIRGRVMSGREVSLVRQEQAVFEAQRTLMQRALVGVAIFAGVAAIVAGLVGYSRVFYRRLAGSAGQVGLLALLMLIALIGSCWVALTQPPIALVAISAPTVMMSVIGAVAHDRRMGLALGIVQTGLLAMALSLPMGVMATAAGGVFVGVWSLSRLRSRGAALRGSAVTGLGLFVGALVFGLLERPQVPAIWRELFADAAWAGVGGFLAGALTLIVLPLVERAFGATTGMTLAELRDPNRPLLRLLQREAPGTYNHSLNVASIAQSAAESIGADGLHVYVGALYHDCGKLNKPLYFVENQSGRVNKHANLSPAMSLLIIVGHVKDGVQLAREYRLPASLIHYIESHHGTTLVEYFFDQAKKRAGEQEGGEPADFEYRYPGPKPRTREAAVLMLADAVESAARSMKEPTPARLEALVRQLATKRLLDGQFDECAITLRELGLISDSLIKSLNAIYHGRIAYPRSEQREEGAEKPKTGTMG